MAPAQIDAFRTAASASVRTAQAPVLLAALRLLLDDAEAAPVTAVASPPRAPSQSPPADIADPDPTGWLALRERVQRARAERDLSYAALAEQLGVTATTLATIISVRRPPSKTMQQRLKAWLAHPATVPEVAAPEAPFRSNREAHTAPPTSPLLSDTHAHAHTEATMAR
jgi:transcriptional regulator with XRE-family HTH domain